jgi:V8-like Glu-specific endopeptidase
MVGISVAGAGCGGSPANHTSNASAASPSSSFAWNAQRFKEIINRLSTASPIPTPTSRTAHLALREGALFYHNSSGGHFCTASSVDSPTDDLLITAAHCINGGNGKGYNKDLVFIPQYRNGSEPYGEWTVDKMLVADQWENSADPDYDVGFFTVKPEDGKNIADVLGSNTLAFNTGFDHVVRIVGYPAKSDEPIACLNRTARQSATQMRFACGGYFGGTSGSPWISNFDLATRKATIIGVIGGYQEGGDTDSVSYSPYFGNDIQALYAKAKALG